MPLNINSFINIARTSGATRDILISGKNDTATLSKGYLGRWSCTDARKAQNTATLEAFRDAMTNMYGDFGKQAFDQVLGGRLSSKASLRAGDVFAAINAMDANFYGQNFMQELDRQMETHPLLEGFSDTVKANIANAVRQDYNTHLSDGIVLSHLKSIDDLSIIVESYIEREVENVLSANPQSAPQQTAVGQGGSVVQPAAHQPLGLRNITANPTQKVLSGNETSVEDRVKAGTLRVGQLINKGTTSPMLYQKLKTNGVEPGFIYRNDWSINDTRGFLAVADPADMNTAAYAAEYMIRLAQDPNVDTTNRPALETLRRLVAGKNLAPLTGTQMTEAQQTALADFKKTNFVIIRNAVMQGPPSNSADVDLPIFRHFSDLHIAKLDYNEGDRWRTASSDLNKGSMHLPDRVMATKGVKFNFRVTTARDASVGAVSEALANDLTRLAGIPAQELSIIRGEYSDGTPKLMLEAKFAKGYQDFDGTFLKDGRIVAEDGGPEPESLGRYKTMFLLLADRDAVGSHGQNKGLINGRTFFAIDPGHSLEGNGQYLEIQDNFSFRDTKGIKLQKRFANFSVFDDATRFEKFQGILQLRSLVRSGQIDALITSYRNAFSVNQSAPQAEQELNRAIQERINEMSDEINAQANKLLTIFDPQLALFDAIAISGSGLEEQAIELTENLEKLTSKTTWMSKKKEVELNHLEVVKGGRIPWTVSVDANNVTYSSSMAVPEERRELLRSMLSELDPGLGLQNILTENDNGTVKLTIPRAMVGKVFNVISEEKIAAATHAEEYAKRTAKLLA